ncbi:MAG: FAD-binding oxidoreductase [Hyphomonadaceae bacterium]
MTQVFRPTDNLTSWGRVVRSRHQVARPNFCDQLPALVRSFSAEEPGLAVGLGRSYGDSNLNPHGRVIDMTALDRLIAFDADAGIMRAEAGVSLSQALQVLVPRGWFLPTTPGTRFVTLAGAVANDVHGKNHHSAGTFGGSVTRLKLHRTNGSVHELAPGDPLFHATIGGLGLTGVIEWVEFQAVRIPSAYVDAQDTPFEHVSDYFDLMAEKKDQYEHTMAWVDCMAGDTKLGRGILTCGNWAAHRGLTPHREHPKRRVPVDAPGFLLGRLTMRTFNSIRHNLKTMRTGPYLEHYEQFLYPLDSIAHWNRLYGSEGFYQYQCALPPETARVGVMQLLDAIIVSGRGSPLAVLKDFGANPPVGLLSFPREGTTLAVDIRNQGEETLDLMAKLDDIVAAAQGRLYPAKDGRVPPELFQAGFPKWQEFRAHVDPGLSSAFWRRVSA